MKEDQIPVYDFYSYNACFFGVILQATVLATGGFDRAARIADIRNGLLSPPLFFAPFRILTCLWKQ